MSVWPVQDAKARFSEMLERCVTEGAQIVTKRGEQQAVLIPYAEWQRMAQGDRPNMAAILLSNLGRGDLPVPKRGTRRHRTPPVF
jgi:prevent-host-death family protein